MWARERRAGMSGSMRRNRLRIVVVDDTADNAEILAATLIQLGHEVRVADTGRLALELLAESLPELVFLDLEMPQMSGFETAARIRERHGDDIRLVALTGSNGRRDRERAERCGFEAFLTKPAQLAQIEAALNPPEDGPRRPLSEPPPMSFPPYASPAGGDQGKLLVLVVERDPHIRELEAFFLKQAGYSIEFSVDGQEALAKARVLLPDVMITEILVPKLDGLALCRQLKADPVTRGISVLIFSILAAGGRAKEAGADAFLTKPLAEHRLVGTVQELLAKRKQWESKDGPR